MKLGERLRGNREPTMGLLGKSGGVVIGLFLIVAGALLKSRLIEALLDITGWIMIIVGIVVLIVGLIGLVTGSRGKSGGY